MSNELEKEFRDLLSLIYDLYRFIEYNGTAGKIVQDIESKVYRLQDKVVRQTDSVCQD